MHSTKFRWPKALAAGIALLSFAPAAQAVDFGVRAGAYLEDADPFAGAELLVQIGRTAWFFNPNIEAIFADERDRISGNIDFHYDFVTNESYYIWAGGGLAIIHTEGNGNRDSDTEPGANFLAGIGWRVPDVTPYAQLKVVAADDAEIVAAVGVRF